MPYVVQATWTAIEGNDDVVLDALRRLTGPSRQEPGCRVYQPYHDPAEPLVFHIVGVYGDEDAHEAHGQSEHYQTFGCGQALPVLQSHERSFYRTVDA